MNKKLKDYLKISGFSLTFIICFTTFLLTFDSSHFLGFEEEDDNTLPKKFFNRFYFTVTTLSSTGYGDTTAKTTEMKMISMFLQFILIVSVIGGFYYSL